MLRQHHALTRISTILLLLAGFLLAYPIHAQEAASADSVETGAWDTSANGKLNFTQAGFQNWQEGGVNTLALSTGISGSAKRSYKSWAQKADLRLAYGLIKQEEDDFRKAEDLIQAQTQLQYLGEGALQHLRPTASLALRTQFAPGFNYDKDPIDDTRTPPVKVSDFFSPAAITQSLGLTYVPREWITQRFGFGAKETVVLIERLRPLYGLDPDQTVRVEVGLEAYTELDKEIFTNVTYQSKLGLFASFNQVDQPDLLWENLILMKVNSWLNVNFEFVSIFDQDVSDKLQLKEVFSIGLAFKLI